VKITRWVAVTAGVALVGGGLLTALLLNTERPAAAVAAATRVDEPETADDAVQRALSASKPTVAEFGANACAQCREMKPVLEALERDHGARIAVVSIDLVKQREANYIRRYRIQLMPTQIFFDAQGREIGRNLGMISGDDILARLQVQASAPGGTGSPAATGSSL